MGKYFGTDGFRGEVNEKLTVDHAYKIGQFLGWYLNEKHKINGIDEPAKVVIGKDTRRSSYSLEYALAAGLTGAGTDAYMMHVTTTPSVAYITRVDRFDCGIMITASHNPFYDNGIKLLNTYGEKMEEGVTDLIEAYLDGVFIWNGKPLKKVPLAKREKMGETVDYASGRNRYIGYLISLGVYSFKGKRVGLDCANGTTWNLAQSIFEALGATVYVINNHPDGFNVNRNSGSTHIEGLQKLVRDNKLDVGFAYDGDADRCLCVDEKGNVVNGDHILYIYAKYMKEREKLLNNTVVTTVMSNFGLYKAFDKIGIEYYKTPVGDKYVHDYMAEHGHRLGGEQSGHIIFSKYATTGDGLLTSIKVMEVMIAKKSTLSKLAEEVTMYPQTLKNVRVADKKRTLSDPDVKAAIEKAEKELGDNGRVLVRESGTEPLIRVMIEASSQSLCEAKANEIVDVIFGKGYVID